MKNLKGWGLLRRYLFSKIQEFTQKKIVRFRSRNSRYFFVLQPLLFFISELNYFYLSKFSNCSDLDYRTSYSILKKFVHYLCAHTCYLRPKFGNTTEIRVTFLPTGFCILNDICQGGCWCIICNVLHAPE